MKVHRVCASVLLLLALVRALQAQATVPTVAQAIPAQSLAEGGPAVLLDLRSHIIVPDVTGQIVQFETVLGRYNFELFADTPLTTANFLTYVTSGAYNNTIIHRSVPGFVVQGGGYTNAVPTAHIPVNAPVRNEFRRANVRGTVAMAKLGGNPDSATSEWFVNLADNRANLDNQNGGFTVFGRVIGSGMSVIDAVAALQTANVTFSASLTLEGVPVRNITAGQTQIQLQNLVAVNTVSVVPLYPAAGGGASVISFSVTNSNPGVATAALSGSTLALTPVGAGSTSITVRATDTHNNAAATTFTVTVAAGLPAFAAQPASQTIATGSTVVFNAPAANASTYQWEKNGVAIPGATNSTLVLPQASAADGGRYVAVAINAAGRSASQPAELTVRTVAPADAGRLSNLSVRTNLGADQSLVVGFATNAAKSVLLRGIGPTLGVFGVTNAYTDPRLELYEGSVRIAENDNWNAALAPTFSAVGAFALALGSRDAALETTVAGPRTAQLKGPNSGVVLLEVYDAGSGTAARLVNVSARNQVGTGDNILIAGFVVDGTVARSLLIRAVGPTLAAFGVPGTLTDPKLEIYTSAGVKVAENDNWSAALAGTAATVGAFALNPDSLDAALLLTLPPGAYSAQVSGVGGRTGEALVEVYEVP